MKTNPSMRPRAGDLGAHRDIGRQRSEDHADRGTDQGEEKAIGECPVDARRRPDVAEMVQSQTLPGLPGRHVIVRQQRDEQQNQDRQHDQQNEQQQAPRRTPA